MLYIDVTEGSKGGVAMGEKEENKKQSQEHTMTVKIEGIIVEGIAWEGEECHYKVDSGGEEYEIISSGKQATLDFLFVQEGQFIEIEGRQSEKEKKNVFSEKSRIKLKDEAGN